MPKHISQFFPEHHENAVIKAEILFTSFLIEYNMPVMSADHAIGLFQAMFFESKIAKMYC